MWFAERWLLPVAWLSLITATVWSLASSGDGNGPMVLAYAGLVLAVVDLSMWVQQEINPRGLRIPEGQRLPVPVWGPFALITGLLSIAAGAVAHGTAAVVLTALGGIAVLVGAVDTGFAFLGGREPIARSTPGLPKDPELIPRHRVRHARSIRRAGAVGEDDVALTGELQPLGRGRTRILVDGEGRYADLVVGAGGAPDEAERIAELAGLHPR